MSANRFFVDKITQPLKLTGEAHKRLSVVLRARIGDEFIVCCGDGYDYLCKAESITKNETALTVLDKTLNGGEPSVNVTAFSAVMKGDKNAFAVQKLTELGVTEIYPVITRYVQGFDRSVKCDRLNKIAVEAAEQCGRSVITKVHEAIEFDKIIPLLGEYDCVVFPYEKATAPSLKEYLHSAFVSFPKKIAVIIGPEGGFDDSEAKALVNAGITPLTLGKRILRAETANVAVVAAIMYESGQWQ